MSALLLAFLLGAAAHADGITLKGVLLERGTRTPIGGANVFLLPAKLKATTSEDGGFTITDVPAGTFTWIVNLAGYQRLELEDQAVPGTGERERRLFLERASYQVYETTVFGREEKRDPVTRSLRMKEVMQIPGAGNDPVKAVQNLPGVNRPAAFSSQVIIQGSAPQDTRYQIDGHEVPLIFHFGGLTSVTPPEILERVDYLSAGYGPENGRALGGLVGVWTRPPRTDRVHGMAFVDVFNSGAVVEGRSGKESAWMLGARKSYIGEVLRAVLPNSDEFDLTAAPSYSDLSALYETRLTPIDRFRVFGIASLDTLEFVFKQPLEAEPDIRGEFFTKTAFFRLIPQLIHRHGSRTESRWSLGIGKNWIRFETTDNHFRLAANYLTPRIDLDRTMSSLWNASWGFDSRFTWATADVFLPAGYFAGGVANPFSAGELRSVQVKADYGNLGMYWKNTIRLGEQSDWSLLPGMRIDRYSGTHEWLALPRIGARFRVTDALTLRTSGGLYAQPPQEQELDAVVGNPAVKAPRAWHLTMGAEQDLRAGSSRGFTISSALFYRFFDRLVVPTTRRVVRAGVLAAENFDNGGRGRAFGAETLVKADFAPWSGWISYTLSKSTRWEPGRQIERDFRFDQTHLLTLIALRELGANWRIGSRFRLATGNPYTPVSSGIFDSDNDTYFPVRGAFYSRRIGAFAQLDARIDKSWIYDTWILSAYLDIQNATNRGNIEAVRYSYDYSIETEVSGLPILPMLGVRAEF